MSLCKRDPCEGHEHIDYTKILSFATDIRGIHRWQKNELERCSKVAVRYPAYITKNLKMKEYGCFKNESIAD